MKSRIGLGLVRGMVGAFWVGFIALGTLLVPWTYAHATIFKLKGTGVVKVEANLAWVTFHISTLSAYKSSAIADNAGIYNSIVADLIKKKYIPEVKPEYIVSSLNTRKNVVYDRTTGTDIEKGFVTTKSVTIKVTDIPNLGQLIDLLNESKSGTSDVKVENPVYGYDKEAEVLRRVQSLAVKDASNNLVSILNSVCGFDSWQVVSVYINPDQGNSAYNRSGSSSMMKLQSSNPLADTLVSSSVEVGYLTYSVDAEVVFDVTETGKDSSGQPCPSDKL